jgi:hypothetical protein
MIHSMVEIGYQMCYHRQYMPQIRISRTKDLENVLSYFRDRYRLLSEADIVKMVLSDRYYEETYPPHDSWLGGIEIGRRAGTFADAVG